MKTSCRKCYFMPFLLRYRMSCFLIVFGIVQKKTAHSLSQNKIYSKAELSDVAVSSHMWLFKFEIIKNEIKFSSLPTLPTL